MKEKKKNNVQIPYINFEAPSYKDFGFSKLKRPQNIFTKNKWNRILWAN